MLSHTNQHDALRVQSILTPSIRSYTMPPPRILGMAFAAALAIGISMAESTHERFHSPSLNKRLVPASKGCYSSAGGNAVSQGTNIYQANSVCEGICVGLQKPVMAFTGGNECYCADLLPAASDELSESECSQSCPGYPDNNCEQSHLRFHPTCR